MLSRALLMVLALACCVCGARATCKLTSAPCSFTCGDKELDLSALSTKDEPWFKDTTDVTGTWQYSFSPCSTFSEGQGCSRVSVCQVDPFDKTKTLPVGTLDSLHLSDVQKNALTLTYNATYNNATRQAVVTLQCNETMETPLLTVEAETTQPDGVSTYAMVLTAKEACLVTPPLTTVPSTNATTVPPANMTTVPSSNVTTAPPANVTTVPPANITTVPPANVTTHPPANVTTGPPANVTTGPPANMTTPITNHTVPGESTPARTSVATTVPGGTSTSTSTSHKPVPTTPSLASATRSASSVLVTVLFLAHFTI